MTATGDDPPAPTISCPYSLHCRLAQCSQSPSAEALKTPGTWLLPLQWLRAGSSAGQAPQHLPVSPRSGDRRLQFFCLIPKVPFFLRFLKGPYLQLDTCWQVAPHLSQPTDRTCWDQLCVFTRKKRQRAKDFYFQLPGSQHEPIRACWVWKHFQFPSQKAVLLTLGHQCSHCPG